MTNMQKRYHTMKDAMKKANRTVKQNQYYPKILPRETLFEKITLACQEIGLEDITIREFNPEFIGSWFTSGAVRETKYNTPEPEQLPEDLAYLIDSSAHPKPSYHIAMVHINYDIFSKEKGEQFYQALKKQGLKPRQYHPSSKPSIANTNDQQIVYR